MKNKHISIICSLVFYWESYIVFFLSNNRINYFVCDVDRMDDGFQYKLWNYHNK